MYFFSLLTINKYFPPGNCYCFYFPPLQNLYFKSAGQQFSCIDPIKALVPWNRPATLTFQIHIKHHENLPGRLSRGSMEAGALPPWNGIPLAFVVFVKKL